MRDLLAYICADESKYRILDLKPAYTASSLRGLFYSLERSFETLSFSRFGLIKAGEVPFEVLNPNKSPNGLNLVVLRGGPNDAYSHTLTDKVTVNVGVSASKLYFLGGVAGWGFPAVKDEGLAIAKVLLKYEDGQTEEMVLKNAVEFADYNGAFDVPGSKPLAEVVRTGQIRWFAKEVKRRAKIDSITLQSTGGPVAPVFVSITAEVAR
jgi:hypothetical protein